MRVKPLIYRAKVVSENGEAIGLRSVNASDLRIDWTPRHETLTQDQWRRLSQVYNAVGKIVTTQPKAEWIDSFRANCHLNREIWIWESIVRTLKHACDADPKRDRCLTLHAVVMISTGVVDIAAHTGLSDAQVEQLRDLYTSVCSQRGEPPAD